MAMKATLPREVIKEWADCILAKGGDSALVAVGADWTDNWNVVGYVNHLREAKMAGSADSRPVYQSTPVLDLFPKESKPGRESVPHFLILDEMNLSHVERYFADFLSAMEAQSGAIRFHDEGDFRLPRFEGDSMGVPRSLPYPQNRRTGFRAF
jgi:5-methylcytosine-specific restriction endonuclease McrBC GTP-binding regulatory subunit McrB